MCRGSRSVEAIRAKRKRHRCAKKKKRKEAWETSIIKSMCNRWEKRRLAFNEELNIEEEKSLVQQQAAEEIRLEREKRKAAEVERRKEVLYSQCQLYNEVAVSSQQSTDDGLLLPSIPVSKSIYSTAAGSQELDSSIPASIVGIDRVAVNSAIQIEREKKLAAYQEAQHYRNLSERLRKEKRELANTLNSKLELVRDFWRNNIAEGSTRAGRIVQMGLKQLDKQ